LATALIRVGATSTFTEDNSLVAAAAADVSAIHPQLEDYLLSLPIAKSDDEFLFPSLAQRKTRSVSPLSEHFRKLMKQAGIEQRQQS
jgi:hypothetical protein